VGEERGGWGGRSYLGKRRLGLRGEIEREERKMGHVCIIDRESPRAASALRERE
jgi:phosphoribosylaminoimidazole carboxylase (NCAIR synthetase)